MFNGKLVLAAVIAASFTALTAALAPTTASAYKFGQGIKGQVLHLPPAGVGVISKPMPTGVNVPKPVHIISRLPRTYGGDGGSPPPGVPCAGNEQRDANGFCVRPRPQLQ
jgi:hypothetical protein